MPRPAAHARHVVALLSLSAAFLAPQKTLAPLHAACTSRARPVYTPRTRLHAKKPPPKKRDGRRLKIATNRKARFTYEIIKTMEAGIALQGTEVKSCRDGNANIADGFARIENGECTLINVDIAKHKTTGDYFQHDARRPRRLLLHKSEIRKLAGDMVDPGFTLIPLSLYFNDKNLLKVDLALCRGKSQRDKRKDIKEREDKRMLARASKGVY